MEIFDFTLPVNLYYGVNQINNILQTILKYGKKIFILVERDLRKNQYVQNILSLLSDNNIEYIIFDDIGSIEDFIEYGSRIARNSYAKCIIGIGRTKLLSLAKAISFLANNYNDIDLFIEEKKIDEKKIIPYIEIPFTPYYPLMFKDEILLTNYKSKKTYILKVKNCYPESIIFDQDITISTFKPDRYKKTENKEIILLLNIIAGCIEGFISTKSNLFSDLFFIKVIEIISDIFNNKITKNENRYWENISKAGLLTNIGLSMSKNGILTCLSYTINSKYQLSKSLINCLFLPDILTFYKNSNALNKLAIISKYFCLHKENLSNKEIVETFIGIIKNKIIENKIPLLRNLVLLNQEQLKNIAQEAKQFDMFNYLPRTCSVDELYNIIQNTYMGNYIYT